MKRNNEEIDTYLWRAFEEWHDNIDYNITLDGLNQDTETDWGTYFDIFQAGWNARIP